MDDLAGGSVGSASDTQADDLMVTFDVDGPVPETTWEDPDPDQPTDEERCAVRVRQVIATLVDAYADEFPDEVEWSTDGFAAITANLEREDDGRITSMHVRPDEDESWTFMFGRGEHGTDRFEYGSHTRTVRGLAPDDVAWVFARALAAHDQDLRVPDERGLLHLPTPSRKATMARRERGYRLCDEIVSTALKDL